MSAGQSGQYNFLRSLWRRDYFAAQYAETKFCADIMSLVYLLNRSYAPYYKWLLRGIAGLPILGKPVCARCLSITRWSKRNARNLLPPVNSHRASPGALVPERFRLSLGAYGVDDCC